MKGSKIDMPLKYRHYLKVTLKPYFRFPIDLLRYDRCCPFEEVDARAIEDSVQGFHDKPIVVVVIAHSESLSPRWTLDRWAGEHAVIESIDRSEVPAARGVGVTA